MKSIISFIVAIAISTLVTAQTPPATQSLRPTNGFVIGVFSQPLSSFDGWTADGVNTFVQWETSNQPLEWWAGTATQKGANTIRVPSTQSTWEQWDTTAIPGAGGIAWALPDEPDGNNVAPASLAATAAQFRANARKLPVWLNVRGGSINGMQPAPSPIQQYLATADWIAEDFYPVTGWGDPTKLLANGQILDQIAQLAPNKPKMCFIECSDQALGWVPNHRCVTPGEFRCQLWDAVIHGAYGVIYFPQKIGGGFSFDARPDAIKTEMRGADLLLKGLIFEAGKPIAAPAPFECCARQWQGAITYIALNTSSSAAKLPTGQSIPAQSVVFIASNPFGAPPAPPVTQPASQPASQPLPPPASQPTVASLQTQLAASQALAASYKSLLDQYSAKIVALNNEVADLQSQVASLQKKKKK